MQIYDGNREQAVEATLDGDTLADFIKTIKAWQGAAKDLKVALETTIPEYRHRASPRPPARGSVVDLMKAPQLHGQAGSAAVIHRAKSPWRSSRSSFTFDSFRKATATMSTARPSRDRRIFRNQPQKVVSSPALSTQRSAASCSGRAPTRQDPSP